METNYRNYEFDLFIAYFCGKGKNSSEKDAQKLYNGLKRLYGNKYRIYFFPAEEFADGSFAGTPEIIAHGCKAFLLVGNGDITLRKEDETLPLGKRSLAEEIGAIQFNPFMRRTVNWGENKPKNSFNVDNRLVPVRGYIPDGRMDLSKDIHDEDIIEAISQSKIFKKEEDKKYLGNPFSGNQPFTFTSEKYTTEDKMIHAVANWLDKVIKLFFERFYVLNDSDIKKECLSSINGKEKTYDDFDLYWVGSRRSEITDCETGLFKGSVCLFGEEEENHFAFCKESDRIDHNLPNQEADMYIYNKTKEIAEQNPKALFYCYNQSIVYNTFDKKEDDPNQLENPYLSRLVNGRPLIDRFICLNEKTVINNYSRKDKFRELCNKARIATVPGLDNITKDNCDYNKLFDRFRSEPNGEKLVKPGVRFVIQSPVGSGGVSTFILSKGPEGARLIDQSLRIGEKYICTIYQEQNVPVNVHALIFKEDKTDKPTVWLSPPSIQILQETDGRLMYRGADYIECQNIDRRFLDAFMKKARCLCEMLSKEGYVGVCGIDGIICNSRDKNAVPDDNVFLLELNTRFQASTGILNRGLHNNDLPSMQMLNLCAFYMSPSSLKWRFYGEKGGYQENLENPDPLDDGRIFANVPIGFSNMSYIFDRCRHQARHLLQYYDPDNTKNNKEFLKRNHIEEYELDGLEPKHIIENDECLNNFERNSYLYRIVFSTNICWVNYSSQLYINENILDEDDETYSYVLAKRTREFPADHVEHMLYTKVALLIQGVKMSEKARAYMQRPGTFQAVDIVFKSADYHENYVVNAPVVDPLNTDEKNEGIKFTELTPFLIDIDEKTNNLILTYYDNEIDEIFLMPKDELPEKETDDKDLAKQRKELPYKAIAYLSTDRLRVHLTNACKFKRCGKSCRFCGIVPGDEKLLDDRVTFSKENVRKVVEDYVATYMKDHRPIRDGGKDYFPMLRHFLVGGQTADLKDKDAEARLIETVATIYKATKGAAEIYAMIVPCAPVTIERMKNNGLTQIAFNMELWDDDIAREIMPGKRGERTRDNYLWTLKVARKIMDKHESVRSMLMVGLEPESNTIAGIKALLGIDVQPMLSIFRPMPDTEFKDYMSPQIKDVVRLYHNAMKLMKKQYKKGRVESNRIMHLGPDCKCCQNNTVALPYETYNTEEENDELF